MSSDKTKFNFESVKQIFRSLVDPHADNSNLFLFAFDILLLPVTLFRVFLIYLWGSRYSVKGFRFLDVIMHADKPHFNRNDADDIDNIKTIGDDYRVVIRDDSRLYPIDIIENAHLLKITETDKIASTRDNDNALNNTAKRDVVRSSMPTPNHDVIGTAHIVRENGEDREDKDRIETKSIWQTSTDDNDRDITDDDRPFKNENTDDIDHLDIDLDESRSNSDDDAENKQEEMDVIDEVNRAVQNIDSRIDLDDSDEEELNTDLDTENVDDTDGDGDDDESDNDDDNPILRRKFPVDSDSESDSEGDGETESDREDTKKEPDPIDILLQRAKARRMKKSKPNRSRPIFEETDVSMVETDETTDRTGSIIDNLESAFEK